MRMLITTLLNGILIIIAFSFFLVPTILSTCTRDGFHHVISTSNVENEKVPIPVKIKNTVLHQ